MSWLHLVILEKPRRALDASEDQLKKDAEAIQVESHTDTTRKDKNFNLMRRNNITLSVQRSRISAGEVTD